MLASLESGLAKGLPESPADDAAFYRAVDQLDTGKLRAYVDLYPQGRHRERAASLIAALRTSFDFVAESREARWVSTVERVEHDGAPAFRFPVEHPHRIRGNCRGHLIVTATNLVYAPATHTSHAFEYTHGEVELTSFDRDRKLQIERRDGDGEWKLQALFERDGKLKGLSKLKKPKTRLYEFLMLAVDDFARAEREISAFLHAGASGSSAASGSSRLSPVSHVRRALLLIPPLSGRPRDGRTAFSRTCRRVPVRPLRSRRRSSLPNRPGVDAGPRSWPA